MSERSELIIGLSPRGQVIASPPRVPTVPEGTTCGEEMA
jgi:hypothetical protein